ncbi:MAG: DUF4124 domain-containing protein [Xanthomonadales bacterium]|nr:DUF4124 domain-containing protein [Xanthomonadales bacterium]
MDKGMTVSKLMMLLMMCFCLNAYGQIYKIVDKDGNVTYTDQAPGDGSEPMDLPELSVVTTDYAADQADADPDPVLNEEDENSTKALRKMYSDFRISRPAPEETFWGTANAVVVAWESSAPLQDGLMVRFTIDGAAQTASAENMLGITLDRGTHTVSAAIVDASGRPVVTTDTVTFYVHQQSVRGNGP